MHILDGDGGDMMVMMEVKVMMVMKMMIVKIMMMKRPLLVATCPRGITRVITASRLGVCNKKQIIRTNPRDRPQEGK